MRARSIKTRENIYNTLVRPHLEYAASVWDPHVTKQKQAIEKVQRRAARWVTNQHDSMSSVTAMLKELNWQPLELRRVHSRLCLLYQITNGIVATPHIPYLLPHSHASRSSRHAHTLQHATYQCRTNYFKYSYFPHTKVLWNDLPQSVVSSPTLVAFKTSLRRGRMPQNCNLDSAGDILLHCNNKQVLFSPYYLTMFSHSLLFLYCTIPFSANHNAHATVIRLNHE